MENNILVEIILTSIIPSRPDIARHSYILNIYILFLNKPVYQIYVMLKCWIKIEYCFFICLQKDLNFKLIEL